MKKYRYLFCGLLVLAIGFSVVYAEISGWQDKKTTDIEIESSSNLTLSVEKSGEHTFEDSNGSETIITNDLPQPKEFSTLSEFKNWINTATLSPTGNDEMLGIYDYLRPGYQEMFLVDRFYLIPSVSDEYVLKKITMDSVEIVFNYVDSNGKDRYYSYCTLSKTLNETIPSSINNLTEYNGVSYYIRTDRKKAYCNFERYVVSATIDVDNSNGVDMGSVERSLQFTRVELPALDIAGE